MLILKQHGSKYYVTNKDGTSRRIPRRQVERFAARALNNKRVQCLPLNNQHDHWEIIQ